LVGTVRKQQRRFAEFTGRQTLTTSSSNQEIVDESTVECELNYPEICIKYDLKAFTTSCDETLALYEIHGYFRPA